MENDRITTLLRRTPPGLGEAEPDYSGLIRTIRRRRIRRLGATSVVTAAALLGLVLPLTQLSGMAGHPGTNRTAAPAAVGTVTTTTVPPATSPPDIGSFACTAAGTEVATPEFAVQSDGVHLHVENPGGAGALVISSPDGRRNYPVNLAGSSSADEVTPYIDPGTYEVTCTEAGAGDVQPSTTPGDEETPVGPLGGSVGVTISNPAGAWIDPALRCSSSTERGILTGQDIDGPAGVPSIVRTAVNGIQASDEIVPAAYPESDEDMQFLVQRDGAAVALVRVLARDLPAHDPPLDVTSCDGSGVGDGQGVR
jgi:hypothetical protein